MGAFSDLLTSGQVDPLRESSTLGSQQQQQPVTPATPFSQAGLIKAGEEADPERPVFELAFGFIPTLNIGNALGIENDVARITTNILADPFAWLPAFFSGGLTVAGKAATAAARLNSSRGLLSLAKGTTATEKVINASKSVEKAAKVLNAPEALLTKAAEAGAKGDVETFAKIMKTILKTKLPEKAQKSLNVTLQDLGNLKDLAKLEAKLKKQVAAGFITQAQMDASMMPGFLKSSRVSQLQAEVSQRSFLRAKLPFSSHDGVTVPFMTGKHLYKFLDAFKPLPVELTTKAAGALSTFKVGDELLQLDDIATTRDAMKGQLFVQDKTLHKAGQEAIENTTKWKDEVETLAPGALDAGLSELMLFFREGAGIPTEILAKHGMLDDAIEMGLKPIKASFGKSQPFKATQGVEILKQEDFAKLLDSKQWLGAAETLNGNLRNHYELLRKFVNEADVDLDIPFLENYVTHFWNIPDKKISKELAKEMKTTGVMLSKRKFENFIEGMGHKFEYKYDDVFKVVEQYRMGVEQIVSARRLVDNLRKTANKIFIDGHEVRMFEDAATIKRLEDAGVDVDAIFVNLAKEGAESRELLKKLNVLSKDIPGKKFKTTSRTWVPKALANDLKVMHAKPFTNDAAVRIDKFNAVSKSLSLALSLFHGAALTETSIATLGPLKGLAEAGKRGFGIPVLSQMLKKGGVGKIAEDVTREAIEHGLIVNPASDAQISMLEKFFEDLAVKMGPTMGKIPLAGKKFTQVMNDALWKNFHEPMKIVGYDHWVKKLEKINPNMDPTQLRRQAADMMNNAFGSQNWRQMLVNPKMKQIMHWALLAPDWTISNLKIAGVGSTGLKGAARGILGQGRNPSEQIVGSYWRTAIPVMYGAANLLNYSLTGKYMWDNPPGHKTDVALGTKDEKGRPEFMTLGKQMREPFRWLTEPLTVFGNKMSPASRTVAEQLTGRSPGSQFPTGFARGAGDPPVTIVEQIPARLKNIGAKFTPFSLGGNSVFLAFPKKSFTETRAVAALIRAAKGGKIGGADAKEIQIILRLSAQANHDVNRVMSRARKEVGSPRGLLGGKK